MMVMLLAAATLLVPDTTRVVRTVPGPIESSVVAVSPTLPRYRLGVSSAARPTDPKQEGPFEYSAGYATRSKIHKIASLATVPMFAAQYWAGEKLLDGERGTAADMHGALAAGVAGLFAVNTVTGVWNLLEARKDPENRTWRTVHGILMLAADAGFVATGVAANSSDKTTHRDIAVGSMAVALVSYAIMLPPFRRD